MRTTACSTCSTPERIPTKDGLYTSGTGNEVAGFVPYAARQNVKELPRDGNGRDQYFVDGSPQVADVWFYAPSFPANNTHLASQWRTVLLGGLRQGGEHIYALDITNPSGVGNPAVCGGNTASPPDALGFPCYLWEFPREDAPAADKALMGQTFSEPVITKIKVRVNGNDNGGAGFDRWVAIFGGGYDPSSDPNDHAAYDVFGTKGARCS